MNARTLTLGQDLIAKEAHYGARNYQPVPVVVDHARDCLVWDVDGREYIDMMGAYSAVSHGHLHPRVVAAAQRQLQRVAVTSRAYHGTTLGPFLEKLCQVAGFERALPMNTGAEAVETAIKCARRWGYRSKGIADGQAQILVARGNFHGRTSTIVGFSSEPDYRAGFGPFAAGFAHFDFGDMASVRAATNANTCAVLIEPIQGEAGVIVPPAGFFAQLRDWCDRNEILLVIDEVQSGLGRTGRWFAFEHEGVRPDALILGKALGGGVLPVSAFLADAKVMDESGGVIRAVRGRGLWVGVDIEPSHASARELVERLAAGGVLSKETHETVIRFAPPLTITRALIDRACGIFREVVLQGRP